MRVLLAEDDFTTAQSHALMLKAEGCVDEVAGYGEDGPERVRP